MFSFQKNDKGLDNPCWRRRHRRLSQLDLSASFFERQFQLPGAGSILYATPQRDARSGETMIKGIEVC
jgi:hypothetical protein